jgi:NADPH:quinone reductase-like Zn-dependent oxidoreductase
MGSKAELLQASAFYFGHKLKPVVHSVMPLPEARRAHETMEASQHFGKIVLQVA